MKKLLSTFALPTAAERATKELRFAELELLGASAALEQWTAQRDMLKLRVIRLREFTSKGI